MTDEIWKDIEGYEGLYQVSNKGRVKRLASYISNGKGEYFKEEHVLSLGKNKQGYCQVGLSKNNKIKSFRVHRLVAKAFIHNPQNKKEVNHINELKDDNRVENLEWCTSSENSRHGTRNERITKTKRKNGAFYERSVIQVDAKTGEYIRKWKSISDAEKAGFDSGHISACCKKKLRTHKGYKWFYADSDFGWKKVQ